MTPREIVRAQWEASQRGKLSVWTIYDRPSDHPQGYIARLYEVGAETEATGTTIVGTLEQIRFWLERAGLVNICRQEGDDPNIVESWI